MVRFVGRLNEAVGRALRYLLVVMMVTVCYEVMARYFFNRPTVWALELNTYLLCVYTLMGGGFTLLRGGHVNVDILYGRLSERKQAVLRCVTSALFFLFTGVLLYTGGVMAYRAFRYGERSGTILDWPLFPTKVLVPAGALLLLAQGLVQFMEDLITVVTGRPAREPKKGGIFGPSKA